MLTSSTCKNMSNQCTTCHKPINWDQKKREELGIRGPLNPDLTPHKCIAEAREKQPVAVTTTTTTAMPPSLVSLTQEEIKLLKDIVAAVQELKRK